MRSDLKCKVGQVSFFSLALAGAIGSSSAWAGEMKPFEGKKVIELPPFKSVQIEMPDQAVHNFGQDFEAILTSQLVGSGKYLVSVRQGPT